MVSGDHLADRTSLPEESKALFGQGKFRDTGRESSGYGEALDSVIGAPARLAIQKAQNGDISWDAVKKIFHQIGADPRTAPTGYDIASKITDNPALGTFLSTAVDFGAQLPGTQFLHPGAIGEIKDIKGMDNLINASELFKAAGKKGPSLDTKIAQMHGQAGEVRDAMPELIGKAQSEQRIADKDRFKKEPEGSTTPRWWHDENDHSLLDEQKESLDKLANRYGQDDAGIISDLRKVHDESGPTRPYGPDPESKMVALPNFNTRPTGQIGEPGYSSHSGPDMNEPFPWIDDKYKSGKSLLEKHKSLGMPAEIHTSSDLIGKDDYINSIPAGSKVNMYFGPSDPKILNSEYPTNPSNKRLESAAQKLQDAGIDVNKVYPDNTRRLGDVVKPPPDEPDGYAHGGTVVQHFADGGAVLPQGFTLDQSPQQETAGDLPQGFTLDEDTYGGVTGMAASAVLGALRGVTLGASDLALTSSGMVKPSTIKGYQETNPGSSMAAEVAGAIGSAVALPELAPAALIAKAGKAVQGGILAADALKTSKALGAVGQILASSAGSAVEGALYSGVTNSLNEKALGDPTLNGEKIAAHFGHGAILGGALGGFLKTAEIGVPEATKALSSTIASVKEKLMGTGVDGSGGIIGAALPDNLSEAFGNRLLTLEESKRGAFVKTIIGDLNAIQKNAKTSLNKVSDSLDSETTSELLTSHKEWLNSLKPKGVDDGISPIQAQLENHANVRSAFEDSFEKKSAFTDAFMTKGSFDAKKVEKAFAKGNEEKLGLLNKWFEDMKAIPSHVEETLATIPTDDSGISSQVDSLKTKITDGVKDYKSSIKKAGKPSATDPIDLAAAFVAQAHPALASAMELYKLGRNPLGAIKQLGEIERMIGKSNESVARGAKALFSSGIKLGDVSKNIVSRLSTEAQVNQNQDLQKQYAEYQSNPQKLVDQLGESTKKLYDVAPETAQSLQMSSSQAVNFLSSKIPSKPEATMFSKPYEPSLSELAKFDRYKSIVEKPTLALEQIKTGLIGPETMEALSAVYPKLLDQMRQKVMLEAANQVKAKNEIPYQLKQSISYFLGQPLSTSLLPQNVMNNQVVFMQAAQAQMQKDKASIPSSKDRKDVVGRMSLHPDSTV
jgi:hypothetical protein